MPAKTRQPMHLYTDDKDWPRVMHDACAAKYKPRYSTALVKEQTVDNARAECVICRLEYDPAEAKKERQAIQRKVAETMARWKAKAETAKPAAE